jgi:hypothetical protein
MTTTIFQVFGSDSIGFKSRIRSKSKKRQTFSFRFCKYRLCFHILYIHSQSFIFATMLSREDLPSIMLIENSYDYRSIAKRGID